MPPTTYKNPAEATAGLGNAFQPQNPEQVAAILRASSLVPSSGTLSTDAFGTSKAPLTIAPTTPLSTPNIAGLGGETAPQAPAPKTQEPVGRLQSLVSRFTGSAKTKSAAIESATAPYASQLVELNKRIKLHQADAIAAEEQALSRPGGTTDMNSLAAQQVSRTASIEAIKLSALAEAVQGNSTLAERHAAAVADLETEQLSLDIQAERANIIDNWDNMTAGQKKLASASLLELNNEDDFVQQQKEDTKTIIGLASAAMANNPNDKNVSLIAERAMASGNLQEAVAMLAPYQKDPMATQKAALELEKTRAEIAKIKAETNKVGVQGQTFDLSTPIGRISSAAHNLASQFDGKYKQEQFLANVSRLSNTGDVQQLADYVYSQAISTLPDAQQRKNITASYNILMKLPELQQRIDAYVAKNGDMGIFKGTIEDIYAKVGLVKDPELRRVGQMLADTLDLIARDRTGAVLTDEEVKFYNKLLPGIGKTAELNTAIIKGLSDSASASINNALKFQLTGSGFTAIENFHSFQPIGGQSPSSGTKEGDTKNYNGVNYKVVNGVWTPSK